MTALAEWTLVEHLGRDWARQVVWRDLDAPAPAGPLAVEDDCGAVSPAQVDRTGRRVYYPAELGRGRRQRYRLVQATADTESPLGWSADAGQIEVRSPGLGLRLAWGPEGSGPSPTQLGQPGARAGAEGAPPLLGLRGPDGVWFGGSSWEGEGWRLGACTAVESGPVRLVLCQGYVREDPGGRQAALELEYEVDCLGQVARLRLRQEGEAPGGLAWRLSPGFRPTQAYWRPHSSSPWRGPTPTDGFKRQVYAIRYGSDGDEVRLGPFYNWEKDVAPFWAGWEEEARRDLLYLGCVRPSLTATRERYERALLRARGEGDETHLDLRFPLQVGRKAFALALLDRDETSVGTGGPPNDLDRLHTRLNGPGLDDYCQMTLDWPGQHGTGFPRLWLDPADLPRIRQRFAGWTWLCE
ncbi:MAG: hypothetical protein ABIL09_09495, partial [Gemmatimonadota bacterium]